MVVKEFVSVLVVDLAQGLDELERILTPAAPMGIGYLGGVKSDDHGSTLTYSWKSRESRKSKASRAMLFCLWKSPVPGGGYSSTRKRVCFILLKRP
jgi:hypothetical protein